MLQVVYLRKLEQNILFLSRKIKLIDIERRSFAVCMQAPLFTFLNFSSFLAFVYFVSHYQMHSLTLTGALTFSRFR